MDADGPQRRLLNNPGEVKWRFLCKDFQVEPGDFGEKSDTRVRKSKVKSSILSTWEDGVTTDEMWETD